MESNYISWSHFLLIYYFDFHWLTNIPKLIKSHTLSSSHLVANFLSVLFRRFLFRDNYLFFFDTRLFDKLQGIVTLKPWKHFLVKFNSRDFPYVVHIKWNVLLTPVKKLMGYGLKLDHALHTQVNMLLTEILFVNFAN